MYPKTTDPDYCAGSNTLCATWDEQHEWFRCPVCARLLKPRPKAHTFYPHVNNRSRTRTSDLIRESLTAHGANIVLPRHWPVYAPAEEDT